MNELKMASKATPPQRVIDAVAGALIAGLLLTLLGPPATPAVQLEATRVLGASPLGCSYWNPYLLPPEAQTWAIATAQQRLPTIVKSARLHLTSLLASGALAQGVEGDFVETGVYTGGTSIIMMQALDKYDPGLTRKHWAADSFEGLPPPVAQDQNGTMRGGRAGMFAAGQDTFLANVRAPQWNISNVDARMHVLKGWFNETLPSAPISKIAFLRLDGDLYASTIDALVSLYDKVSHGGIVYVDDYGSFTGCQRAVDEFRAQRNIAEPLMLQPLPDTLLDAPPGSARWEAAWWIKGACL